MTILFFFLLTLSGPATAQEKAPPEIQVSGKLATAEGTPVSGVTLELTPAPSRFEELERALVEAEEAVPLSSTVTNDSGLFTLSLPEAGYWRIRFRTPAGVLFLDRPIVASKSLGTVTIPMTEKVDIRVMSGDQEVTGARITSALAPSRGRSNQVALEFLGTVTDENGTANFQRLQGSTMAVLVAKPGYALHVEKLDKGDQVLVGLSKVGLWPFLLVDENGQPVREVLATFAGAPVDMATETGPFGLHLPESGSFAVEFLSRAGHATQLEVLGKTLVGNSAAEAVAAKTIELRAPQKITGRAAAFDTKEPLEGALVWDEVSAHWTETDRRGSFELAVAPQRQRGTRLGAAAVGYAPAERSPQSESGSVNFELLPATTIEGLVVDHWGAPVAGATARAGDVAGVTGEDGSFRLVDARKGNPVTIWATHELYPPSKLEFERGGGKALARIVLARGRPAVGWVVDVEDQPIPGASISLSSSEWRSFSPWNTPQAYLAETSLTDAEGMFRMTKVGPGTYDLHASRTGFAPSLVPGLRVGQSEGEVELGTVLLEVGLKVEGQVLDVDGNPVAGVQVGVSMPDRPMQVSDYVTGGDGRFAIDDAGPADIFNFRFEHPGFLPKQLSRVRSGSPPLTVELVALV